ncbi:MAG TPA: crosslink repair DNA glycosylase YcaQ family protein, partial [bacterium]
KAGFDLVAIEQELIRLLSQQKELSANELKKQLPDYLKGEYLSYALRYFEFAGKLARTNHRYLTDRVIRYGLMTEWFPEIVQNELDPEQALQLLILQYIKKFGPLCLDDLSWWLSITKTISRKILEALGESLASFDFNGQVHYMEKADHEKFELFEFDHDQSEIITFLPYEDHFPKAYFIRNRFLSDQVATLVYKEGVIFRGQIFPSIWLNGEIIGGWEMNWVDKNKSAMKVAVTAIHENKKLSAQIYDLIESHRADLERFINEKLVPLMSK